MAMLVLVLGPVVHVICDLRFATVIQILKIKHQKLSHKPHINIQIYVYMHMRNAPWTMGRHGAMS
jgi:hypothetical protein